jgi:hypothetical protein
MRYEWDPSKALRSVEIMSVDSSNPQSDDQDDLALEYRFDYNKAKPNRFATQSSDRRLTVVVLDEDVAQVFSTPEAVNQALRDLIPLKA